VPEVPLDLNVGNMEEKTNKRATVTKGMRAEYDLSGGVRASITNHGSAAMF
jgi:hypothetical protein